MIAADQASNTSTDLLRMWAGRTPADIATYHRAPSGEWCPTTWSSLWHDVQQIAQRFSTLGLRRGDRLAIFSRTCREWQLAEQAGTLLGATIVGIDPHAAGEQAGWILEHAGVSCLVADTWENLAKIPVRLRESLTFALIIDAPEKQRNFANVQTWRDAMAVPVKELAPEWTTDADAPAILIYTSGTTGTPKGIEYTHAQLMTACRAMLTEFPDLQQPNRLVCWLPMAALFQRMINLMAFAGRSVTYFVEDPREIMLRVGEVRPTVFFSVPRFYERLHDAMRAQLASQSGVKKHLANAALAAGAQWAQCIRAGKRPGLGLRIRHALLDRLVLQRLRAAMGGEIKWMITGSAAAPVWLLEFFHSIGLLLLEAYGITENPVPIAANRPDAYRFGSVGKPFAMNDVRLTETGEVLVKGPAVFRGYRGEGRQAERFTDDGYYRTGDCGRLDADGFLYLTGRLAEIIKTSTGRRISPAAVEGVYRQSRYVDHVVVIGNNRPYVVGLVALNAPAVQAALASSSPGGSVSDSYAVLDLVDADFAVLGKALGRHEQIRAFRLLPEGLSIERGELTATLKPRRERIEERYAALVDEMYAEQHETVMLNVMK